MVDAAAVGLAGARMKKLTAEAQVDGMADGMIAEMMAAGGASNQPWRQQQPSARLSFCCTRPSPSLLKHLLKEEGGAAE